MRISEFQQFIRDRYYDPRTLLRSPLGVSETADAVVAGTLETLAEFPDRQLLADDVVIGTKPVGFYSSHRVRSTATHAGNGRFGHLRLHLHSVVAVERIAFHDGRVDALAAEDVLEALHDRGGAGAGRARDGDDRMAD